MCKYAPPAVTWAKVPFLHPQHTKKRHLLIDDGGVVVMSVLEWCGGTPGQYFARGAIQQD